MKRSEEDEAIIPAFVTAVEQMSHDLSKITMNDEYKPYVSVCYRFPLVKGLLLTGTTRPSAALSDTLPLELL